MVLSTEEMLQAYLKECVNMESKNEAVMIMRDEIPMIIDALEKQIPQKVVKVKLRETEWGTPYRCPVCECDLTPVEFIEVEYLKPRQEAYCTWCDGCGQKIDWSEE